MNPPASGAVAARHFPAPQPLLPGILELHARWRPNRTAVICGDDRLDWAGLGARTGRVAAALQASGMQPGDRVAVLMDNRLETLEVLLGAIRAGCCSVPLNLSVTDEALTGMIEDSGAAMVIATVDQAQRLGDALPELVRVRVGDEAGPANWTTWADWLAAAGDFAPASVDPDTPLNIIYSSGTTGRPKGIVHTQRGRLDWAMDLAQALRYHGAARTLVTLPLYSNISWVMLLCTLVPGGTLILQDGFDTGAALETIETEAVTHTAMVPLQYQRLLDDPRFGDRDVSSMQAMMSCGSPLHAGLKERVLDAFPCGVIELYGLTEGVITILDPEEARDRLSSVGRPLVGTDIGIVDDGDRILGPDADGEIVARGRITMPGYHGRPDADEEATFVDTEGRVWLRTGDLGRRDAEGWDSIASSCT